jgi:hypothetical protein
MLAWASARALPRVAMRIGFMLGEGRKNLTPRHDGAGAQERGF